MHQQVWPENDSQPSIRDLGAPSQSTSLRRWADANPCNRQLHPGRLGRREGRSRRPDPPAAQHHDHAPDGLAGRLAGCHRLWAIVVASLVAVLEFKTPGNTRRPRNRRRSDRSRERESNPRQPLYKSGALPAELSRRRKRGAGAPAGARLRIPPSILPVAASQPRARRACRWASTLRLTRWRALSTVLGSQSSASPIAS
jgi:hypothetical protein